MQTFAAQSVLAIQNANLFTEVEEKSRQLYEAVQVLEQSKILLEKEIEERKQGEEVLRNSEARYRANQQRLNAVMNSVADAVITLDGDGSIQSFNRGAERTFGYSITEDAAVPLSTVISLLGG